jgi:hypothetical protein
MMTYYPDRQIIVPGIILERLTEFAAAEQAATGNALAAARRRDGQDDPGLISTIYAWRRLANQLPERTSRV